MKDQRGFSLLLVLLVLIGMTVLGLTTLAIGTTEAGTAEARAVQRQALAAADAGLNHLMGSSATIAPNQWVVGSAGDDDDDYIPLADTMNHRGQVVRSRYHVQILEAVPTMTDGYYVESVGQVLIAGRIVGQSLVRAIITTMPGGRSGNSKLDQKSGDESGGSNNSVTNTDISLVNLP